MRTHTITSIQEGIITEVMCKSVPAKVSFQHFCGGTKWVCCRCNEEIIGADLERIQMILKKG